MTLTHFFKAAKYSVLCCFFCLVGTLDLAAQVRLDESGEVVRTDTLSLTFEVIDGNSNQFIQAFAIHNGKQVWCNDLGRVTLTCLPLESIEFSAEGFNSSWYWVDPMLLGKKNPVERIYLYNLSKQLEAITVAGYGSRRGNLSTPASVGVVRVAQRPGDGSSLQSAFNEVSGVSFDSRGYGGSARLNIRGSFYRAPTTIRNVKMYWKGIALTSADGQAPIELIDANTVSSASILKGPGSGVWGNGTGGVIVFEPLGAYSNMGKLSHEVGEFGYRKSLIQAAVKGKSSNFSVSQIFQQTNGYRLQEANKKQQTLLEFNASTKRWKHYAMAMLYDGSWQLPGSLSQAQVTQDPRQANAFSVANNAHVERNRKMIGYSGEYLTKQLIRLELSGNVFVTDKINPYGTSASASGFKDESAKGQGQRVVASRSFYSKDDATVPIKFKAAVGEEVQWEAFQLNEFGLLNGASDGNAKYNFHVDYTTSNFFYQMEAEVKNRWFVSASAGMNNIQSHITGTSKDALMNWNTVDARTNASPNARLYPNVGLSYNLLKSTKWGSWYAFANYSTGSSAPTIFEQYDYANQTLNTHLQNEFARNTEVGIKGTPKNAYFEINAYDQLVIGAIIPGSVLYNGYYATYSNAGKLVQRGVEYLVRTTVQAQRWRWEGWSSGSWTNYTVEGSTTSGRMPGMPLATCSQGMKFVFLNSISATVSNTWTDKTPLNSSLTSWAPARNVMNAEIGYSHWFTRVTEGGDFMVKTIKMLGDISAHVGVNNALNTVYTTYYQLNAAGDKFFNPMARRNFYAGISLRYFL